MIALFLLGKNFVGNGWSTLTSKDFIIPQESSLSRFRVTVMNEGSGEWWVYGQDSRYYYYFTGDKTAPYLKFPVERAAGCQGFDPTNYLTWCGL